MTDDLCRDYGQRVSDRQKTRLMWLVEEMGAEKFRQTVSKYIGYDLKPGKHITVSCLNPAQLDLRCWSIL